MSRTNWLFCVMALALRTTACTFAHTPPTGEESIHFLGFVESDQFGSRPGTRLRVTFQNEIGVWRSLQDGSQNTKFDVAAKAVGREQPSSMSWQLCSRGESLGRIRSRPVAPVAWAELGTHEIIAGYEAQATEEDLGRETQNGRKGRALVATSRGACGDPAQWKRVVPSPATLSRIDAVNNTAFRDIQNCGPDGTLKPYLIQPQDVAIKDAWQSRFGEMYITLKIEPQHQDVLASCDGLPGDQWLDQLFHADTDRGFTWQGAGVRFWDAGDYDEDGRSEVVLRWSRTNNEAYQIRDSAPCLHCVFRWVYH